MAKKPRPDIHRGRPKVGKKGASRKRAQKATSRKRAKKATSRKRAKKAAPRKRRAPAPADPTALTTAQAAQLLRVPADVIGRHLASGAPADPAGRINLVHYAAWLNRRLQTNPDSSGEDADGR